MYRLTEEGRSYLENGLPELNLVKILENPMKIEEAKGRVENFSIALQWAKKRGWIRIDRGMLVLVKKPERLPEEEALSMISQKRDIDDKMITLLLSRRLIEKERETVEKARKMIGKEIANLTPSLLKTGLWRKVRLKPYNVLAMGSRIYPGKRHPYNSFLMNARQKLVELGFREMTGPIIETEFWNFDTLYQPQDHPSRDWTQTYSLKYPRQGRLPNPGIVNRVKQTHENGWKTGSTGWGGRWDPKKAAKLMPRAHDTAISPRYLSGFSGRIEIPGKYFSLVRCFRPDVIDATHGIEFNQLGGFVIDKNLTFRNLLGLLKEFIKEITGFTEVRFKPDYFPFTSPSVEVSAKHPEMGWFELAGAGIFRTELTQPLGVKEPVIAWGFGIDRLAMMRLNIEDIRELFSRNLKWLRESKIVLR